MHGGRRRRGPPAISDAMDATCTGCLHFGVLDVGGHGGEAEASAGRADGKRAANTTGWAHASTSIGSEV